MFNDFNAHLQNANHTHCIRVIETNEFIMSYTTHAAAQSMCSFLNKGHVKAGNAPQYYVTSFTP